MICYAIVILAIDIGTADLKTAFIDKAGDFHDYRIEKIPCGLEIDPRKWLLALRACLVDPGRATKVIICGNAPTLVPVLTSLDYLDFSIEVPKAQLWLRGDAAEEARTISDLCGHYIDASFVLPKILKIRKDDPELYRSAVFLPGSAEFLCWALGSELSSAMPPEGLEDWYWREGWADKLGLDKSKLPPFAQLGSCIGSVSLEASGFFGLGEGIPIYAPCVDFIADLCGSGVMKPGLLCDRMGTSEGLNLCASQKDPDSRLMSYRHPNGRDYNTSGIISNCAKALGLGKALIGLDDMGWDEFYALASTSPLGSNGLVFLPYFDGERAPIWDPEARAGFFFSRSDSSLADKARAICEGVCLAAQSVISLFSQKVESITITGGPSNSAFLCQLKADLSGIATRTLLSPCTELSGLGAIAMSDIPIDKASNLVAKTSHTYAPDQQAKTLRLEMLDRFRKAYEISKGDR